MSLYLTLISCQFVSYLLYLLACMDFFFLCIHVLCMKGVCMCVSDEELREKAAFMSSVSMLTLSSGVLRVLLPAAEGNCNHNNR